MKPDKIFDIYSENYDLKFNSNPVAIYQRGYVHNILKPILANAKTLLDVGCGPGSDFDLYSQFAIKITAFDISPKMVQFAQEKSESINLNAQIYNSSIELFETENKFDVILLNFGVVNVFPKLTENLKKLEMLLEENGKLIIVSMPSFHLFSVLGNVFRFNQKKLYNRLILKKSIFENGFEFYYYSRSDFNKNFKIIKKCNLCSILPTPDQYAKNKFLRFYFKVLWRIDKCFGKYLPVFLGGDHILFELEKK